MPSNDNFRTCICKHIIPLDKCWCILKHFDKNEAFWCILGKFEQFWATFSNAKQFWAAARVISSNLEHSCCASLGHVEPQYGMVDHGHGSKRS